MPDYKTALICQGGGMRSAFSAGVLYELSGGLKINYFDILIGSSSSAPNVTYFLTGQVEEMKTIWQTELATPVFLNKTNFFKGEPIFNTRYLISQVLQKKYPLDLKKIQSLPADLYIPFYNFLNDKIEFYHNHGQNGQLDLWQALRATMTIHDQFLQEGDGPTCYIDPAIASPLVYEKAFLEGASYYLIVANQYYTKSTLKRWLGYHLFKLFQGRHFPEEVQDKLKRWPEIYKKQLSDLQAFVKKQPVLVVQPPAEANLKVITKNAKETKKAFDLGRKAIQALKTHPLIKIFQERSK